MAPRVIVVAPLPVKITYVTYKMEHVWSVQQVHMAVTVIYRVPQTVITTHVTQSAELAFHVNLDGLDYTVKQVILLNTYVIKLLLTGFVCIFVFINRISAISFCKHISENR